MAKILLIDDDEQVRKFLNNLLSEKGHEVIEAPNGRTGTELFQVRPVDIVITDIVMSEQDGIETIKNLKRIDPEVKIIATSGGCVSIAPTQGLRLAMFLGAIAAIKKPFGGSEIITAVEKAVAD